MLFSFSCITHLICYIIITLSKLWYISMGNCSKVNINKMFVIKKRSIRTINFADFRSHTNGYFRTDNILKISDLYYYCLGIFMYQLNKGDLPNVFTPMFIKNNAVHSYPTRQIDHFHLFRVRTVFALKTIIHSGPTFWNALNKEIIESPSLNCFKRKLKESFLNSYDPLWLWN